MDQGFSLQGRTALITGAGGGLGTHFAHTLARAGASVVLAGRREAPLLELARQIEDRYARRALVALMDVTDEASVQAGFEQAEAGGASIDVVVCNAGIAVTRKSLELSHDDWHSVLDTNLTGCWNVAREAARRLVAAGRPGVIVNISSMLGHRVAGAVLPYTVAKAGLEQMTRALALEWARHGIRVNALAPGYIETDLNHDFFASQAGQAMIGRIPQRRLGRVQDLEGPLLLLASDASSYMTGATVVVDGGHLHSTL